MHELSVTSSLIRLVVAECIKQKITKPKKIIVDLGGITAYSKDSVLFYYDILKNDEPLLRKTTLRINEIPGKILCNDCKKESVIQDACMMFCPCCSSRNVSIISGKEFLLKEIETKR